MKIGSVVQLKSGGPHMTVVEGPMLPMSSVSGITWRCMWFSGKLEYSEIPNVSINREEVYGESHSAIFPEKALQSV